MEKNMNVVYAMTRNVYPWIIPSITSLVEHNPDVNIFILAEDVSLPRLRLPKPCTVINVREQFWFDQNSVNYNNMFKYINLLKVVYPSILGVDRVIHLDIDTIICGSLKGLWETDCEGKWFAACPEYVNTWYKPFGDRYYNMGVALINLDQMRKDGVEPKLVRYLATVKQPFADQDAWNKYGIEQDKIADLDLRFNESVVTGCTDDPVIVHYCSIGDWFTNRTMFRHEYIDRYR